MKRDECSHSEGTNLAKHAHTFQVYWMSQDNMWLIESKALKSKKCGSIHTRYEILTTYRYYEIRSTHVLNLWLWIDAEPYSKQEQNSIQSLRLYSNHIYSNDDYLLVKEHDVFQGWILCVISF